MPLNEVYNNLGVAEEALNQPAAVDDFRRAYEGDPNDSLYEFNLGVALLDQKSYDEAVKHLSVAADDDPDDNDAQTMLALAQDKTAPPPDTKLPLARLKQNFDATAFRELKAMLTPKGGS